jgi:hypothetical protein
MLPMIGDGMEDIPGEGSPPLNITFCVSNLNVQEEKWGYTLGHYAYLNM